VLYGDEKGKKKKVLVDRSSHGLPPQLSHKRPGVVVAQHEVRWGVGSLGEAEGKHGLLEVALRLERLQHSGFIFDRERSEAQTQDPIECHAFLEEHIRFVLANNAAKGLHSHSDRFVGSLYRDVVVH